MKCNLRIILLIGNFYIVLMIVLSTISQVNSEFLQANKAKLSSATKAKDPLPKMDDVISDKEIQELLKDPKYADIAGNPDLVKSLTASLKEEPLASSHVPTSTHRAPNALASSNSRSHYMSPGYKAHLARVKHTTPSSTKDDLHALDDDPLLKTSKNDLMKDLSLDSLPLDSSISPLNTNHKKSFESSLGSTEKSEEKIEKLDVNDKFKDFDFLSKQQARYLIEILKQPVFLNMLPSEAQNMVKVIII